MRKSKRRQTNLISLIIVLVTVACIVALIIAMVHQASLEMRFDAIINFLKKIEKAVAGLNTHMEILACKNAASFAGKRSFHYSRHGVSAFHRIDYKSFMQPDVFCYKISRGQIHRRRLGHDDFEYSSGSLYKKLGAL